jgi:hypothetical protein
MSVKPKNQTDVFKKLNAQSYFLPPCNNVVIWFFYLTAKPNISHHKLLLELSTCPSLK